MGRRYRKSRYYKKYRTPNPHVVLVLLLLALIQPTEEGILGLGALIGIVLLVRYFIKQKNKQPIADTESSPQPSSETDSVKQEQLYASKASIMTDCEKAFFGAIKKLVEPKYIVQPQVNLASVINKEAQSRYRNELFRNIDFGIFDKDYKLLLLIEIHDQTHMSYSRRDRDEKVKCICAEANIPLIVFWTKYGVNENYIKKRLSEYLVIFEEPENAENQQTPIANVSSPASVQTQTVANGSYQRHQWTLAEDELCCRKYFEWYIVNHSTMDLPQFVHVLEKDLPDISAGSLRMKTQNIKQLCIEHGIRDSLDAKPLAQYSRQNAAAFQRVKKEFGF